MPTRLTCPRGHQWEATDGASGTCPVCGPADSSAASPEYHVLDTIEFVAPDQGLSAATPPPARKPPASPGLKPFRHEDYEILGELSRGGMGVVYKARQRAFNRLVALKALIPGAGPEQLSRLQAEAEILARLDHPNIVRLFEVLEADGVPFLVMELCEGGSLWEKIRDRSLDLRQTAEMVLTLARAVQAAHEQGIIHRDLKPANVLLTKAGVPKIADFCLARILGDPGEAVTATGTLVGTPSYMPPELLTGRTLAAGPAVDIYGLGAILYELLTGRRPFADGTLVDLVHQILEREPVPPRQLQPQLPRDLERIALKCLKKDPGQRYVSAGALADDLRRFLEPAPILARRAGLWRRLVDGVRRRVRPARPAVDRIEEVPGEVKQLRALLDRLDDGIIRCDPDGATLQANPAAEQLFGAPLTGLSLSVWGARDVFCKNGSQTPAGVEESPLARALRGDAVEETEVFIRPRARPEGLWVDISAWPLPEGGAALVVRDVTTRRALRDSEALAHSLIESLPMSVFRKDLEGRYTFANRRFCDTLGTTLDDLRGRTDFDFFPAEMAEKYRRDEMGLLETQQLFEEIEEHVTSACGAHCRCGASAAAPGTQYIQVLLAPVFDAARRVIGTQGAFWNVTPRLLVERQLEQTAADLRRANAELARSNAELEQFAYVASHDLQEPLRMVASYTQLLQRRFRDRLDADANDFIAFAVDGAMRMQGLIQDLLAYSRVSSRGQPPAETSAEAVFGEAIKNLEAAVRESRAVVTHDPLPVVWADATQLTQVFQNLIGNAIKFCRGRVPVVHVSGRYRNGEWLFTVRDNGIGIDPRHQERIFAIFQRLHTREQYSGSGIGLAICKKIVERHGGRIWVESLPGRGSTFSFTLRGTCPSPVGAASRAAPANGPPRLGGPTDADRPEP